VVCFKVSWGNYTRASGEYLEHSVMMADMLSGLKPQTL
jgi:hypothetical protein